MRVAGGGVIVLLLRSIIRMLRQNVVWTSRSDIGGFAKKSRREQRFHSQQTSLRMKNIQVLKPGSLGALGLWLISVLLPLTAPAPTYNLFTTQVPRPGDFFQDYPNGVLGTRLHSDLAGRITALRYWAQPGDNDATTLILWDYASQTELASVSGTPDGSGGWFQLSLPSPVAVTAGTEYVITYNAGALAMYVGWSHFFDTPLVNGPLTASVGAGIFGDSGFPNQGPFQNASYFADVVFETDVGMSVQGNGVTIAANATSPNTADGTQFGGVKINGGEQSRTFTITNIGSANLVLSGNPAVVISGAQASDFSVTTQPVSPVTPHSTSTFTVRFAPAGAGVRGATVVITNNAGGPYQFAIEGIGMGAVYRLLGNQTGSGFRSIPAGQISGSRFTALRNMRLSQINTRVGRLASAAGNAVMKCAIYADTGGGLPELLGGTTELVNPTNGWYSLPLTQPVNVGVLSNYWLVVWANADECLVYANTSGQFSWFTWAYDSTWPAQVDLTQGLTNGTLCVYTEGLPTDNTGPEMEVQGNAVWIPAGSTNISSANGTDLGAKTLGGSLVQSYTILNVGQSGLALTGTPPVTVIGPQASDFVVTAQPSGSVTTGSGTTLTITCTPSGIGARNATVVIPHADSDTSYQFAIRAEGLSPGAGVLGYDGIGIDSRFIDDRTISGNRFMAPSDLRISELHAKVVGITGTFACAVYADNAGVPGRLLSGTTPVINPANGWNTFVLSSPLNITGGQFYWLTIWADTVGAALQADPGGTTYEAAYNYAALAGQWPDPIFLNPIGEARTYCIYAEGTPLTPPPGASIDLRGSGKLIVSGDTTPSVLDGTDFGSVAVGSGHLDHTFTIQNSGTASLLLTGTPPVTITGPQAADFQVISPPSSPVAAGGSSTFTLRFAPTAKGLSGATVNIPSNDPDPARTPYQFAVQGAGFLTGRESLFPDSEVGGDVNNDGTYYELGIVFQAAVPGTITQLRVYSVAGESGDHSCRIWDTAAQTVLGGPYIWNFGGVNGWIYLDIPPVSIDANIQYTVVISTSDVPNRDYANEPGVLLNGGGNGLDLTYPPSAGVFNDHQRGGLPTQTWNGSSYLRDIVFVPSSSTTAFASMEVRGNGLLIPDGYSSPATTNLTDFGHTPVGGAGVEQTFVITNSGAAALNLTGSPKVHFAGAHAADFAVVTQPATPVAAKGAAPFTIRFSPAATGTRQAVIVVENDEKNPYYFAISGVGDTSQTPFRITSVATDLTTGNVTLQWTGPNQPFYVDRANSLSGAFTQIGQVQSGTNYTDPGILLTNARAFYRIRY